MASDENMTIHSSTTMHEEDDDDYVNDLHHSHPHYLSRLSMCVYDKNHGDHEDDDDEGKGDHGDMGMSMSRLSIECSDGGDADEEFSDEKETKRVSGLSSDSDKEPGCYSLPVTPPRTRTRRGSLNQPIRAIKDYASENEAHKSIRGKARKNSRRRIVRERWIERSWEKKNNAVSGESESLLVITRPKGGRRSLCMDFEEVKACKDLGFELEHERMLEFPSRISISGSTVDTSSGGNSPIGNWRISSPGDDPRDVKARLKVWAQAVALASSSTSRPF